MLIPPEEFAAGRRRRQWPRAGLPRARAPRRDLRHRLRREHDPHPLVRRGVGHGGAAQHRARATCRATAWRPTGRGPRGRWCSSSPRSRCRDGHLRGRRRRAGRGLRHGRARADELGGGRRDALGVAAARAGVDASPSCSSRSSSPTRRWSTSSSGRTASRSPSFFIGASSSPQSSRASGGRRSCARAGRAGRGGRASSSPRRAAARSV